MGRLLIVGCNGQGKVAADIAVKMKKYDEICFLDDNPKKKFCMGFPVIGNSNYTEISQSDEIFVAIGNATIREKMLKKYKLMGMIIATLIHPNAVIGMNVIIGVGTIIMAGAVINPDTKLGEGVIVNTGATIDHDNRISDYVHVSVGVHLAGTVTVGKRTWIGAGTVISNNLSIYRDCMIGAGATVIRNIKEEGTYVGIPARKVK